LKTPQAEHVEPNTDDNNNSCGNVVEDQMLERDDDCCIGDTSFTRYMTNELTSFNAFCVVLGSIERAPDFGREPLDLEICSQSSLTFCERMTIRNRRILQAEEK
jgi:hypothetical protein